MEGLNLCLFRRRIFPSDKILMIRQYRFPEIDWDLHWTERDREPNSFRAR